MAAVQSQSCPRAKDLNLNGVRSIDEYTGKYFSMNEWIMKQILTSVDDNGYKAIAEFIATFNIMELNNLLFSYATAITVIVVLLLCAVVLLLYFFVQVVLRCCLRRIEYDHNVTHKKMIFESVWLIVCSLISVFGVIVFVTSVIHIQTGVSSAKDVFNNVLDGVLEFVKGYASTLKCLLSTETNILNTRLSKETSLMKKEVHDIINFAFNKQELADIDASMKDLSAKTTALKSDKFLTAVVPGLINFCDQLLNQLNQAGPELVNLRKNFQDIETKVNDGLANVDNKLKSAVKFLSKVSPQVDDVLINVEKVLKEAKVKTNDIWTNIGAEGYVSLALLVVVVPVALPVLLVIATITLLTRFVRNNFDKRRGVLDKIGGYVIGSSGYVSIFIGIYNFLIATAFFLVAFAALFVCMALFRDNGMRSVQLIPPNIRSYNFTIPDVDNFNIDVVVSLHKCTNGIPFFDAINGYKVMARERIKKAMGNTKSTGYIDIFMNYDIRPAINQNRLVANKLEQGINKLKPFSAQLSNSQAASEFEEAINSLHTLMDAQYKRLTKLHGRAHRDRLLRNVKRKIADVEDALVDSIAKLYSIVLDWSPQCTNMLRLYNSVGDFLCESISQPAQGLWIACVICGFASYLALNAAFNATKYLYKKETKEQVDDEGGESSTKKPAKLKSKKSSDKKSGDDSNTSEKQPDQTDEKTDKVDVKLNAKPSSDKQATDKLPEAYNLWDKGK